MAVEASFLTHYLRLPSQDRHSLAQRPSDDFWRVDGRYCAVASCSLAAGAITSERMSVSPMVWLRSLSLQGRTTTNPASINANCSMWTRIIVRFCIVFYDICQLVVALAGASSQRYSNFGKLVQGYRPLSDSSYS